MATLGGNITQRPRCWYFRSSDFDCKKKGGTSQDCHAHEGENQYHAMMNNSTCAMVHPSSTAVPLLAMNAQVELTSQARQAERGDERLLCSAGEEPDQRDRCAARRTHHEDLRARAGTRHALGLPEIRGEGELRLAARGCRHSAGDGWGSVAARLPS